MFSIAIDGPAGAGKTTVAKGLAEKMNILYVDTGAFYRTVALAIQRNGWELNNLGTELLHTLKIEVCMEDNLQKMHLNGEDVTKMLRTPDISKLASDASAFPVVRASLIDAQRELARRTSVVMEGRDIGTVVLSNATLKVFLTARSEIRAERRLKQIGNTNLSITEIQQAMAERDHNDSSRAIAPLRQADDAYYIDSSEMTIEDVEKRVLELLQRKTSNGIIYCVQ